MPIFTNVPQVTFGPAGFIAPSEQAVLAGVIADNQTIFGGSLNPALNTAQGQLASTDTAIIGQANATFVYYTNQVDPAFATGRMQDAIGRIYFITRLPALPTVVSCVCTGAATTIIPIGTLVKAQDGNLYQANNRLVIGSGGTVTGDFSCTINGPIACPANQLNIIYQAIPGWDSITNPADGVIGSNVESRAAFETRRQESVAKNARGTIQAIKGAVLSVADVLDSFSYQNDSATPLTYRGVTLIPHSIYVAVVGGEDQAIGEAIWSKKAPGAGYNGSTTVTVEDTSPDYTVPYPSYDVSFQRPTPLTIKFNVVIAANELVPSDAAAQIQAAIIAAFSGASGSARARIGSTIYASQYVCPIAALGPWVQIISLEVGAPTPLGNSVSSNINQIPVTSAGDIMVSIT